MARAGAFFVLAPAGFGVFCFLVWLVFFFVLAFFTARRGVALGRFFAGPPLPAREADCFGAEGRRLDLVLGARVFRLEADLAADDDFDFRRFFAVNFEVLCPAKS